MTASPHQTKRSSMPSSSNLGDHGIVTNKEKLRQLTDISSGKVFEFKIHSGEGKRIWGMFVGQGEMLLSHGGPKPGDRQLRSEVECAEAFIDEWKRNG